MKSTIKKIASPDLQTSSRRNNFDWTHRRCFTSIHGQLTPCMVMDLKPADFVDLQSLEHTRTSPVLSQPYVRLREHIDYFFVPYAQLWKAFDNFITQQSNYDDVNLSATLLDKIPATTPYMLAANVRQMFLDYHISEDCVDNSVPKGLHKSTLATDAHRLAQYLGYFGFPANTFMAPDAGDAESFMSVFGGYIPSVYMNPFRLAAYQKIYYDFYRNDKYESCDTEAFNFNDMSSNGGQQGATGSIPLSRIKKLFTMHYAWRNKDYFMMSTPNILPSSSFIGFEGFRAQVSQFFIHNTSQNPNYLSLQKPMTSSNTSSSMNNFTGSQVNFNQGQFGGVDISDDKILSGVNDTDSDGALYSASDVRWTLALERLLKRMYAAKNNFADQMRAIFGDAPIDYRGGFVQHIGGMSNSLSFEATEIQSYEAAASLSERVGAKYGQIDSKYQHKSLKFRAHEHGVLMGIYYTSVDNDYTPFRINRFNFKFSYEDYFNPLFQTMGKQPILNWEFAIPTWQLDQQHGTTNLLPSTEPKVIGFVERYHEYKVPQDEILGDFTQGRINWVVPFNYGKWNEFGESLNQYNMTYRPDDLADLFGMDAMQGLAGQFVGDQFLNELVVVCDKTSEMDYIGDEL